MRHIPVAYATEKEYVKCTIISILSMMETAGSGTFYDIYILIDKGVTDKLQQFILECVKPYKNQSDIKFIVMGDIFDTAFLCIDFIKTPTYFRLLLPELLQEKKCIYLDSDTIICSDLQKLYDVELKENYIAGVKAPAFILENSQEHCEQALLPKIEQYVNAGVLVLNLEEMRKNRLIKKFFELLPFNMPLQDQDIMNSACYNHIVFLPFEFNVMTKYSMWNVSDYKEVFSEKEIIKAWNNPSIIHYADRVKPWKNLNCVMGDYWWNVCKRSKIWEHAYKGMLEDLFLGTLYSAGLTDNNFTTKKTGALFDILYTRNLVIFGAGSRAIQFITFLRENGIIPKYILVSDCMCNPSTIGEIEVKGISDIKEKNNDKTLIIATLEKYHVEILSLLQNYDFKEIIPLCDKWS